MKIAFDFVPLGVFLAVLLVWDIYIATAVLIAALWLSVVLWRLVYGSFRRSNVLVALGATALGGLTLYLHDATFIKLKPTLVYFAFALVMAVNALLRRKPLTQSMFGEAFEMPADRWRHLERAWIAFWVACALLNLAVAHVASDNVWGIYKFVSAFALPILFMAALWPFIGRYLKHEKAEA